MEEKTVDSEFQKSSQIFNNGQDETEAFRNAGLGGKTI